MNSDEIFNDNMNCSLAIIGNNYSKKEANKQNNNIYTETLIVMVSFFMYKLKLGHSQKVNGFQTCSINITEF